MVRLTLIRGCFDQSSFDNSVGIAMGGLEFKSLAWVTFSEEKRYGNGVPSLNVHPLMKG